MAICRMDRGEKSNVICKGVYGYELNPPAEFGLELMAELHFTLSLKDFEKVCAVARNFFFGKTVKETRITLF